MIGFNDLIFSILKTNISTSLFNIRLLLQILCSIKIKIKRIKVSLSLTILILCNWNNILISSNIKDYLNCFKYLNLWILSISKIWEYYLMQSVFVFNYINTFKIYMLNNIILIIKVKLHKNLSLFTLFIERVKVCSNFDNFSTNQFECFWWLLSLKEFLEHWIF